MLTTAVLLIVSMTASPAQRQPATQLPAAVSSAPTCSASATLGLDAGPVTAAVRQRLALPADVSGVVVTHVVEGGPAAAANLRVDDVIVAVDGAPVTTDCALIGASWNRSCDDAMLVTWRAGQTRTVTVSPVEALPLLTSRCDAGDAHACFRQAWLLWADGADAARRSSALALYDRSCRGGSAQGCAYYGVALGDSAAAVAQQHAAFERACTLKDAAGCGHLAYLYATGDGVTRDHARATAFYEQACALGDPMGCYNVGLNHEEGRGVTRNVARAAEAYEAGCEGGSPKACTNLGGLLNGTARGTPDPVRAVAAWRRGCEGSACEGANLLGCVNLARAFRDGIGGTADPAQAADLFGAVCDNAIDNAVPAATQQVKACALLGGMHLAATAPDSNAARGRALSERACDDGDDFACFNAATAHATGLGGPVDEDRASTYFDAGCTAGDAESCYELSRRLEEGRGIARDATRASSVRSLACAGGFQKACGSAKR
jgi:TPR repeat protein